MRRKTKITPVVGARTRPTRSSTTKPVEPLHDEQTTPLELSQPNKESDIHEAVSDVHVDGIVTKAQECENATTADSLSLDKLTNEAALNQDVSGQGKGETNEDATVSQEATANNGTSKVDASQVEPAPTKPAVGVVRSRLKIPKAMPNIKISSDRNKSKAAAAKVGALPVPPVSNSETPPRERRVYGLASNVVPVPVQMTIEAAAAANKDAQVAKSPTQPLTALVPAALINRLPEKRAAAKRANEFKELLLQKRKQFRNVREPVKRDSLTMLDLIYYNPPGEKMASKKKEVSSSVALENLPFLNRASSVMSDAASTTAADEEMVDNPDVVSGSGDKPEEEPEVEAEVTGPRVKVGPNGEIMLDEQSLVIRQAQPQKPLQVTVEDGTETNYASFRKKKSSQQLWSATETARFYKALSICGTDFTLMCYFFKHRTRYDLKNKFKREERNNPHLVDKAIHHPTQFDMSGLSIEDEEVVVEKGEGEKKRRGRKRKGSSDTKPERAPRGKPGRRPSSSSTSSSTAAKKSSQKQQRYLDDEEATLSSDDDDDPAKLRIDDANDDEYIPPRRISSSDDAASASAIVLQKKTRPYRFSRKLTIEDYVSDEEEGIRRRDDVVRDNDDVITTSSREQQRHLQPDDEEQNGDDSGEGVVDAYFSLNIPTSTVSCEEGETTLVPFHSDENFAHVV